MKKALSKFRRNKQPEEPKGRITTDTLAEHREKVLAGGRKFKYPVQYARHRLVINAIIISLAALVLLIVLGWYLLYPAQSTSDFMYRVTKVIPVPVATVEGEPVRYSDYLMKLRGAQHYLIEKEQVDISTEDGQRQLDFVKRSSMDDAIADAYAGKLARDLGLTVTDDEVETFLKQQRQSSDGETISETTQNTTIVEYYGWSPDEYRQLMKTKLLRQKVAFALDTAAKSTADAIEATVKSGNTDLNAIATAQNAQRADSAVYWAAAWVPKTNQDGGLAAAAAKLEKGQVSTAIKAPAGNGYYYVKLIDSNDTQVQYEYIFVPLGAFSAQLSEARENDEVHEWITIEDSNTVNQ